jgi:Tol biopolymer transport system component
MSRTRFRHVLKVTAAVGLLGALAVAQGQGGADQLLQAARTKATVEGKLDEAIKLYADVAAKFKADRPTVVRALIEMADCYEKLGQSKSRELYEQIVRDYGDQKDVAEQARARLARLGPFRPNSRAASGPTKRRLSTEASAVGTPSDDGRYLARTDWQTGEILIDDLATGATRRLMKMSPGTASERAGLPVIAPDNTLVAYWSATSSGVELRVVPSDGSAAPRVVCSRTNLDGFASVSWMPDGKSLLAVGWRKGAGGAIAEVVAIANGQGRVVKTTENDLPQDPVVSPDGRYVAYDIPPQGQRDGARDLFVLALADLREWPLDPNPANDEMVGWTSDGARIVFLSDRSGTTDLWSLPVVDGKRGGPADDLQKNIGAVNDAHLVRGGALYYSVVTDRPDVYLWQLDLAGGTVVGEPAHVIERLPQGHTNPDFSLDGRYLSFITRAGQGENALTVRDLASGAERQVPAAGRLFNPRLSPDGESLVAGGGGQPGEPGYTRVDVRTGERSLVLKTLPGLNGFNNVSWMPDGRSIFYLRHLSEEKLVRVLTRRELATGADRELARVAAPQYVGDCAASPDGQWVGFVRLDESEPATTELCLVPADGGGIRPVCRFDGMIRALAWAPDSRQVVFVGTPKGAETAGLWRVPADGGVPIRVKGFDRPVLQFGQFRMHPDGRRIAFSAGRPGAEFWVLENFLPKPVAPGAKVK